MTLSFRGDVIAAVHAKMMRLAAKRILAGTAMTEDLVVNTGVQASKAPVTENNLRSWMDFGYTRPDGGCGKWMFRA